MIVSMRDFSHRCKITEQKCSYKMTEFDCAEVNFLEKYCIVNWFELQVL